VSTCSCTYPVFYRRLTTFLYHYVMKILFMIVMPIAVVILIISLILNMTMIFMPLSISGYAWYFGWLTLTSSLFIIFLVLIIRFLYKDSDEPAGRKSRKGMIWGVIFFLALDLLAFSYMRPLVLDIPSLFHPATVSITDPDFNVSSGNEDNYYYLSGADENGDFYTFHLPSQQYKACRNAYAAKENAVMEVTYLPHSKYTLQIEVK
jgi:hypothetical protein